MKKVSDGWHTIHGVDCLVEDDCIVRGVVDGRTVYPFRAHWEYVTKPEGTRRVQRGWDRWERPTVAAFNAAYSRETAIFS